MYDDFNINWIFKSLIQRGGGLVARRSERTETSYFMKYFIDHGWDPVYVSQTIRYLTDDMISDWHPRVFANAYAKTAARALPTTDNIYKALIAIGLRKDISRYHAWAVEPLADTCYTSLQLIYLIIDKITWDLHKPITLTTQWPLHPNIVMRWYPINSRISGLNINGTCSMRKAPTLLSSIAELTRNIHNSHNIYYHSTSWSSSFSIFDNVDHTMGRICLDFGVLPGFYMSETIDVAIEWASVNRRSTSKQSAIIIFALPRILPSNIKVCNLEGDNWKRITEEARKCMGSGNGEIHEIRNCDYIYGDMVANVRGIRNGEKPLPHTPPKKQLTSKSELGDRYLQQHIIGCLFFSNK